MTAEIAAKLYFPQFDPLIGTVQAYAIFFVGFVVGGVIVTRAEDFSTM